MAPQSRNCAAHSAMIERLQAGDDRMERMERSLDRVEKKIDALTSAIQGAVASANPGLTGQLHELAARVALLEKANESLKSGTWAVIRPLLTGLAWALLGAAGMKFL